MLIVHPASTCDVCLDAYNWLTPANSPHAIACGHVFCLGCLRSLSPTICPLCRKGFQSDRIKKLHIDRYIGDGPDVIIDAEESELLRRVALFFGDNAPEEDVNSVIGEAQDWLATRPDNLSSHRALRSAVTALHRHKTLQQQARLDQERFEELRRQYERSLGMKDQDIREAKSVEEMLISDAHRMEEEFKAKLAEAETALTALRSGYGTSHPDVARYRNYNNPLPAPPQPLPNEQLTSLSRPYTSHSMRSVPGVASIAANGGAGRSSTVRTRPEPLRSDVSQSIPEDLDELRQDRSLRPPVIIPGAPPTRRVIPPRPPTEDALDSRRRAWTDDRASTMTAPTSTNIPFSSGIPNSGRMEAHNVVDQIPAASRNGYLIAPGNAWWSNGVDGSLSNVEAQHGPIMWYDRPSEPTVEEPSWTLGVTVSTGVTETTRDRSQGYVGHVRSEASLTVPPTNADTRDTSVPSNSDSNTSSIASLRSMALLHPPAQNGSRSTDPGAHREILEILGVPPVPSEPSPASTWGTVNSSQASSRHSSLADLGLIGLPGGMPTFPRGEEPHVVPSAPISNDRGPIVEDPTTPRMRRPSFGRSGATVEDSEPAQGESGLGLSLGSGSTAGNTHRIVTGQEDLQHLGRSLMQLTVRDGGDTHHRHHHPLLQSSRAATTVNGGHVGARTGLMLYSSRSHTEPRSEDEAISGLHSLSRASNRTSRQGQRHGSFSDTESYAPLSASSGYNRRISPDHSRHVQSDYSRHLRRSSMSGTAPTAENTSRSRRPSVSSRVSEPDVVPPPPFSIGGPRDRRGYDSSALTRAFTTPANANPQAYMAAPLAPMTQQSSLLLSFGPPTPGASAAVTQRGEDSSIHAPRPVSSRHAASFGLFSSRNAR